MAPRHTRTTHPARSPQTEAMLKARSIDFEFEANLAVVDIREADGYQVRLMKNRAPKDQVTKYATAMKHGATFPAIVLNENMELIDGNTRLHGRLKNGDDTIAAYILFGVTALDARSLSVELNQSNGLAMTEEEIRRFIDGAVKDGQQPEVRALARMTGVSEPKITRWIAETQFVSRCARAGIADRFRLRGPHGPGRGGEATHRVREEDGRPGQQRPIRERGAGDRAGRARAARRRDPRCGVGL
jgi:hypothetical protein